jgi:hypothetical protein
MTVSFQRKRRSSAPAVEIKHSRGVGSDSTSRLAKRNEEAMKSQSSAGGSGAANGSTQVGSLPLNIDFGVGLSSSGLTYLVDFILIPLSPIFVILILHY